MKGVILKDAHFVIFIDIEATENLSTIIDYKIDFKMSILTSFARQHYQQQARHICRRS